LKEVQIKDLLNNLSPIATIAGEENDYETEVVRTIESTEFEDENQGFLASDNEGKDGDDGNNPGAFLAHITAESLIDTENTDRLANFTTSVYISGKVANCSRPFGTPNTLAKPP
jgi:hypothetical protein